MIKIIITRKVNNVTLKQNKINVKVESKPIEVVRIDRVILRETLNSNSYYNKQDIDNKLDNKISIPDIAEWSAFDLALSM